MRNSLFPENGLHTLSVGHHECDSHFETFISSKACKNSFKYYHSRGTVNNYIVFRLVQFLSPLLLPKDAKILQFMYKYGQAMRPPPVKRTRCLDALEPYFKPLLLTAAKITFQDTETKRGEVRATVCLSPCTRMCANRARRDTPAHFEDVPITIDLNESSSTSHNTLRYTIEIDGLRKALLITTATLPRRAVPLRT